MTRITVLFCLIALLAGSGAAAQEILDAAKAGDLARVKTLLSADPAQIAVKSANGKTPLIYAAQGGHLAVVTYLIDHGAEVNAQNAGNETALLYATYFGHADVVECLLDHGADPNLTSGDGDTALDLAVLQKAGPIIALLESRGGVRAPIPAPEVLRLTDKIHKIAFPFGESPSILAYCGRDGWLLVDTGWPKAVPALRMTLKQIADREIAVILNTHEHPDHIGGNAIAGAKTRILSFARLDTLAAAGVIRAGGGPLTGRSGMSFSRYYTFDFGGEEIRLIPAAGAHTDADMIAHFTGSNVVDMGDLLILQSFPSVTEAVDAYLELLAKVCDVFPEDAVLVCGHGSGGSTKDVVSYRRMLIEVRDQVTGWIGQARSKDEILKDPALAEYASFGTFIPVLSVSYWVEAIWKSRHPGE